MLTGLDWNGQVGWMEKQWLRNKRFQKCATFCGGAYCTAHHILAGSFVHSIEQSACNQLLSCIKMYVACISIVINWAQQFTEQNIRLQLFSEGTYQMCAHTKDRYNALHCNAMQNERKTRARRKAATKKCWNAEEKKNWPWYSLRHSVSLSNYN